MTAHEQLVFDGFIKAKPLRPKAKHVIHYAVFDGKEHGSECYRVVDRNLVGDHENALIHTQLVHANPAAWPKQLLWRQKGIVFTNGTGVGYVRRQTFEKKAYQGLRKELARQPSKSH